MYPVFTKSLQHIQRQKVNLGLTFPQSPQDKANISKSFLEYRKKSSILLLRVMNVIGIGLWLWFAIIIDPIMHPGFSGLIHSRIALCMIAGLTFLLSFYPKTKKYGLMMLYITFLTVLIVYSLIGGYLVDDPNYISEIGFVLILFIFIPVPLITMLAFYVLSICFFSASLLIFFPSSLSIKEIYSLHNLAIAYVICFIGRFAMHRYQFKLFMNHLRLEEMATVDSLTQVFNRRYFLNIMEWEFQQSKRYKKQFALMIADLDYFKKINDTYGHAVGDYVLKEFASICNRVIRKTDIMCRYGGEEFAVMMPNTDIEDARILAERIRKTVDEAVFEYQAFRIHLTVSMGLVSFPLVNANDPQELLVKADEFLYIAKEKGRNCVCWQMKE